MSIEERCALRLSNLDAQVEMHKVRLAKNISRASILILLVSVFVTAAALLTGLGWIERLSFVQSELSEITLVDDPTVRLLQRLIEVLDGLIARLVGVLVGVTLVVGGLWGIGVDRSAVWGMLLTIP